MRGQLWLPAAERCLLNLDDDLDTNHNCHDTSVKNLHHILAANDAKQSWQHH